MDAERALTLIDRGESLTVELKATLSGKSARAICKEIAALATSKGGFLVVGVSDDRKILGLADAQGVRDKIERWTADLISPTPIIDPAVVKIDDKEIVVVEVANGTSPIYAYDGRFYGRIGTSSCVLTPKQLIDVIRGRKIEDVITSLESSIALAHAAASTAMISTAPAITGQGELATMNYQHVRDRIFTELRSAAAYTSLESGIAIAQSTASMALISAAPFIHSQGDLATRNYDEIRAKLFTDLQNASVISSLRSEIAALQAHLSMADMNVQALQARLDNLKNV